MGLDNLHYPYVPKDNVYEDKDFIGFTFNGRHSSEFHIVRVADGSRYEDTLVPNVKDITLNVPGREGTYFFGQTIENRTFTVNYAFDSINETDLEALTSWLGDKQAHELIFDEMPYKTYIAKVTGTAQMKSLCFNKTLSPTSTIREYRGEGSIEFTTYFPYAQCKKKYLGDYDLTKYPLWAEWYSEAGIYAKENRDDIIHEEVAPEGQSIFTMLAHNRGDIADIPLVFTLALSSEDDGMLSIPDFTLELRSNISNISIHVAAQDLGRMATGLADFELEYDSYTNLWNLYSKEDETTRTLKSRLWGLSAHDDRLLMPLSEDIEFVLTINESGYAKEDVSIQYAYWYY